MIPWTAFHANARQYCQAIDNGIELREHRLIHVEEGPSMATYVLNSPMLELAHERQFVVSQQGGESKDFEIAHTRRIEECLMVLNHHLTMQRSENGSFSGSVPVVDHVGLWTIGQPSNRPSELELADMLTRPSHSTAYHQDQPTAAAAASSSSSSSSSSFSPSCFDRSGTPATPSLIDVEDSEMSEEFDLKATHVNSFPDVTRAAYSNKVHGPRQRRSARVRKKRVDHKKGKVWAEYSETGTVVYSKTERLPWIAEYSFLQGSAPFAISSESPPTASTSATSQDTLRPASFPPLRLAQLLSPDIR